MIQKSHRYYEAIKILQQAGIIDGVHGTFQPNEKMTCAQLGKVLLL
ncbi:S-layer homology domain-containing protein [Metasolibacillus sp.]|nr:S-layer homology domain-containing protein [Metasolibacillus sp.]MCT6926314.1 S-layer homology domain-containing protein [Metasolibacillus sp.]MCT6942563.1 S-layer homology domain-containing protein [Metasolibacillus sp.]